MELAHRHPRRFARSIAILACVAALVGGCIAGGTDGDVGGDPCAQAAALCPRIASAQQCSPVLACESKCLIDTRCDLGAPFMTCLGECNRTYGPNGGNGTTGDAGSVVTDTGTTRDDTGTPGGDDTAPPPGTGGGAGCSRSDDYSCTCIAGDVDDGKGCSPSTLAAPAACCATSSRCRCEAVSCTTNDSGCGCVLLGAAPGGTSTTSCTGALCCAYPASSSIGVGMCICFDHPGTGGCDGGTKVSSCGADTTPCYFTDEHSVSTCSGAPAGGDDAGSGGA